MACVGRLLSSRVIDLTKLALLNGTAIYQRSVSCTTPVVSRIIDYSLTHPEKLPEPAPEYPGYIVSKEDFKYVERLLPKELVPPPPTSALTGEPTPSGWVPPKEDSKINLYFVHRTRNHMLPIYLYYKRGKSRVLTKVGKVDGDIWKLEADLRVFLEKSTGKKVFTQVHEISSYIMAKGDLCEDICKFLLSKGF